MVQVKGEGSSSSDSGMSRQSGTVVCVCVLGEKKEHRGKVLTGYFIYIMGQVSTSYMHTFGSVVIITSKHCPNV